MRAARFIIITAAACLGLLAGCKTKAPPTRAQIQQQTVLTNMALEEQKIHPRIRAIGCCLTW